VGLCGLMSSGTHEKLVLEAGILEKLVDVVIEMSEKDEENVSVKSRQNYFEFVYRFLFVMRV